MATSASCRVIVVVGSSICGLAVSVGLLSRLYDSLLSSSGSIPALSLPFRLRIFEQHAKIRRGGAGLGLDAESIQILTSETQALGVPGHLAKAWRHDHCSPLKTEYNVRAISNSSSSSSTTTATATSASPITTLLSVNSSYNHEAIHWDSLHNLLLQALEFYAHKITELIEKTNKNKSNNDSDFRLSSLLSLGTAVVEISSLSPDTNDPHNPLTVKLKTSTATPTFSYTSLRCAVVIGCDGVASTVRAHLSHIPKSIPLKYTGYLAWRGVLDLDRSLVSAHSNSRCTVELSDLASASTVDPLVSLTHSLFAQFPNLDTSIYFVVTDDGGHAVIYTLKGRRVNWLWYRDTPEPTDKTKITVEATEQQIKEMRCASSSVFGSSSYSSLSTLMSLTAGPWLNYIYDRDPIASSYCDVTTNRIFLCGEAAHPCSPHGLKSTNLSIKDAHALATLLTKPLSSSSSSSTTPFSPSFLRSVVFDYTLSRGPANFNSVLHSRYLGQLKQGRVKYANEKNSKYTGTDITASSLSLYDAGVINRQVTPVEYASKGKFAWSKVDTSSAWARATDSRNLANWCDQDWIKNSIKNNLEKLIKETKPTPKSNL